MRRDACLDLGPESESFHKIGFAVYRKGTTSAILKSRETLYERAVAPGAEAPNLGESLAQRYNPLARKLKSLDMPVICAVNGVAAGANIALACDIVIASRRASFIQAFCKIGLLPDSGGSWTLPRLVGHARAMALSLLGDNDSPTSRPDSRMQSYFTVTE